MRTILSLFVASLILNPFNAFAADESISDHASGGVIDYGKLPLCEDAGLLNKITKRFHKTNLKYRNDDVTIVSIEHVQETDYIGNPKHAIDRRFCAADALLNDGSTAKLYYMILENNGLASIGSGLDFCIIGFDPERAYGDNCRSVRAQL